ncbi:hypothetical protein TRP8649_01641 [Pelagimonas phthalicica]|uniref:Uncharacterized protein n=2 Tax=Pelagimonas phthalicica TaxID=1037362 RepID=A0A238JCH1_9RHOB|nr:hypothetical protein CLV87_0431 [Pelagimonas phthalicica]SMX27536.1 hypothetical protein TRP8649_01641 [Pelagimonas phthalicica]
MAAQTCSRHAPNLLQIASRLKSAGFSSSSHPRIEGTRAKLTDSQRLEYLVSESGIVVFLRSNSAEQKSLFCSVSVPDMTVPQARQLAQIWIERYGATDKTLFKETPLKGDLLGWQAVLDRSSVKIGMLSSIGYLDGPGAAIVLQYATKPAGAAVQGPRIIIKKMR